MNTQKYDYPSQNKKLSIGKKFETISNLANIHATRVRESWEEGRDSFSCFPSERVLAEGLSVGLFSVTN